MAYRYGNRKQIGLFPQSIEEYVSEDNVVRVYDFFVESLNFEELGIEIDSSRVGNSQYDPKTMLKLLVYGYSYGVKSSRKLERECHHNISFIWLMGGMRPDHKTIAEFRRKNRLALHGVLRQCAKLCIKLKLIEGNVLFLDGAKIRANASRHKTHDKKYFKRLLKEVDKRIENLLNDCEQIDNEEEGLGSYVTMNKDLAKEQNLKRRIEEALKEDKDRVNLTDPDCANMRSIQGSHASYNVQNVVDDKHGLIVNSEAVSDATDIYQFADQIDKANEVSGKKCEAACADAGYANTDELEKIDKKDIKVIVPSQRQALHKESGPYSKDKFKYDKEKDCYYCPEGHQLSYQGTDAKTGKRHYRIANKKTCSDCPHFGKCTKAKKGRKIVRLKNEEVKKKLEAQYEQESSQKVYARRKAKVEHPFGHIKRNLKTDSFLMRGKEGVQAEVSLLATSFNLRRLITILGISALLEKLAELGSLSLSFT